MLDPYANAIDSPVGIVRIPARRERELLAYRILGRLAYPDGSVSPGTEDEMTEARTWLTPAL